MTETKIEDRIRNLAYQLWQTAEGQAGQTFDYWLMAERMVLEASVASARFTRAAFLSTAQMRPDPSLSLSALYVYRTRELAFTMWQAAGMQYTSAFDFWSAAEKHMLAMMEQSARAAGSTVGADRAVANFFEQFSAPDYVQRIRDLAYALWVKAGEPYGNPLDFWVKAEEEILGPDQSADTDTTAVPANGTPAAAKPVTSPSAERSPAADAPAKAAPPTKQPKNRRAATARRPAAKTDG